MAEWDIESILELHETSTIEDIQNWLETCEDAYAGRTDQTVQTQWGRCFLNSCRDQFDENVKSGKERPLSSKLLARLKSMYDKVD